jgi:hypothetical protein
MIDGAGTAIFHKFVIICGVHDERKVIETLDNVAEQLVFKDLRVQMS